jgi:hypothetical protein
MQIKIIFAQRINMITTRYKAKQIYLIFFIGMILCACRGNKKVDVSNIDLEVKIERFDQDFDAMRTQPMAQQAIHLHNKYKVFYQDFIERILPVGNINDTTYFKTLRKVFANKAYNDLRHDVEATYPKLDKQEAELTDAFKHIKYYYPQKRIPKVLQLFFWFPGANIYRRWIFCNRARSFFGCQFPVLSLHYQRVPALFIKALYARKYYAPGS